MKHRVSGQQLSGHTTMIASKSVLHRLLIAAALCGTPTVIEGVSYSQDMEATIACVRSALADVVCERDRVTVLPYPTPRIGALLDCGESGSTLRFLLPVMAACGGARFTGRGRLAERPLAPVYPLLEEHGCTLSTQGRFPLSVTGRLSGTGFTIDGSISSQFISGLLLAAPLLGVSCQIEVTGEMSSLPYIWLTIDVLSRFGVEVALEGHQLTVTGSYRSPGIIGAEGDWSNAAFWLVGAAISGSEEYSVRGVSEASLQGDRRIVSLLHEAGFSVLQAEDGWRVRQTCARKALTIDATDIPDLVPIAAVLATALEGQTIIRGAARLVHKESNRLQSVCAMVTALGGRARVTEDGLVVRGTPLHGGVVDGYHDHRIVMAAAMAALRCSEPVTIVGSEAVAKSYPAFFEELAERGMQVCHLSKESD